MKTKVSIRFSLTGGQVDWMMKIFFPRTVSTGSQMTSPEGKRRILRSPSRTPKMDAMDEANSSLADKEKRTALSLSMV